MSRKAGYSLFEVLIAFAVMTMVLSVVLPRQADFLERSTASAKRAFAADIAFSRLSELGTSRVLTKGSTIEQVSGWVLRQHVDLHPGSTDTLEMLEITLSLEDKHGKVVFTTTEVRADK